MLLAAFMLALNVGAQTRVIAHRGYWDKEGAAQNSRASLQNALELNIYGSETDIWITADGHLMVNHDPSFGGVTGERMPELKTFLKMMRKTKSSTKLIIEIKKHAERNANLAAAQAAVKAVEKYGVAGKVEYISFSLDVCKELVRCAPKARVAYLNGDIAPETLARDGITGIDYQLKVLRKHPDWVAEAHRLNMDVNVWTVNKVEDMRAMKQLGVDFITTNKPLEAMSVCDEQPSF